jgi:HPt (histidine-containing phosphotransfer) domain-containing protein
MLSGPAPAQSVGRWLPGWRRMTDQVLDPQRISELRTAFAGQDPAEIVKRLEEEVASQLRQIAAALDEKDGRAAAWATHRLLASAYMIGAAELVAAAQELLAQAPVDLYAARTAENRTRELWVGALAALESEMLHRV